MLYHTHTKYKIKVPGTQQPN